MASVHEIGIASDTRAFDEGFRKGVIKPVEDAVEALDDLGKSRGPEQLEADLKDAQKQTEKLSDETKDTARQIERSYDDAGRKVGKGLDDGFDKARRGADDFKREANSSLRETAASVSSVEDALDLVQEVAANAFEGFGPVGAGAGLVTALGFGLLLENLRQQGEAADEMKRRWADAYKSAAEEGRDFLDEQQVLGEANDIRFNPDRVNEYNQAVKDAEALNLSINDVLLARAGDEESLQVVIDTTKQKYGEVFADFARARSLEADEIVKIQDRYTALGDEHTKNAEKARASQDLRNQYHEQEREQIDRTAAAAQSRYEGIARQYGHPVRVRVEVDDRTRTQVDRIVQRINGQVARIQVSAGINGRSME